MVISSAGVLAARDGSAILTGFCGVFLRQTGEAGGSSETGFRAAKRIAAQSLSRNPDHTIQTFDDDRFFVAFFDNGAWDTERRIERDDDFVGAVSGNPIVTGADGVSNDPAGSAHQVLRALGAGDWEVLKRPAGGFAAVHWHRRARRLRLCAGTLPQRPIYVRVLPHICFFSTSLRLIRAMAMEPLRVRDQGIGEMLYLGRCLGKGTILDGVDLVTHGNVIEVTGETYVRRRYFDWCAIAPSDDNEEVAALRLHRLFVQAIKRRLRGSRTVDAYLSGGLDTRCVIGGLLDEGARVRAFTHPYKDSSDDILAGLMGKRFGIEHVVKEAFPHDRMKLTFDLYAFYAKKHFPPVDGDIRRARIMWSGDWGSFLLGGGTGETESGRMAARSLDVATINKLFGYIKGRLTRSVKGMSRLRELTFLGAKRELESLNPIRVDRRLFLYYMLNDQNRVLHDHYEEIDHSNIEFETPFYDFDFVSAIVSLPTDMIVGHRLYYRWMTHFKAPVTEVPWQAYPGHLPCPLPMPAGVLNQWRTDWYSKVLPPVLEGVTAATLKDRNPEVWRFLDWRVVMALRVANAIGIRRFGYESSSIRMVYEAITGRRIFPLP